MSDTQLVDETVEMIFRIFPNGEVIALMPGLTDSFKSSECMSYMHVGQHSVCNLKHITSKTRLATPAEYQELYLELRYREYVIKVIKRTHPKHLQARLAEIDGYYQLRANGNAQK